MYGRLKRTVNFLDKRGSMNSFERIFSNFLETFPVILTGIL